MSVCSKSTSSERECVCRDKWGRGGLHDGTIFVFGSAFRPPLQDVFPLGLLRADVSTAFGCGHVDSVHLLTERHPRLVRSHGRKVAWRLLRVVVVLRATSDRRGVRSVRVREGAEVGVRLRLRVVLARVERDRLRVAALAREPGPGWVWLASFALDVFRDGTRDPTGRLAARLLAPRHLGLRRQGLLLLVLREQVARTRAVFAREGRVVVRRERVRRGSVAEHWHLSRQGLSSRTKSVESALVAVTGRLPEPFQGFSRILIGSDSALQTTSRYAVRTSCGDNAGSREGDEPR